MINVNNSAIVFTVKTFFASFQGTDASLNVQYGARKTVSLYTPGDKPEEQATSFTCCFIVNESLLPVNVHGVARLQGYEVVVLLNGGPRLNCQSPIDEDFALVRRGLA